VHEHVRRLIDLLAADASGTQQQDRAGIESHLRVQFPADRKAFIERVGGGRIDGHSRPGGRPPGDRR